MKDDQLAFAKLGDEIASKLEGLTYLADMIKECGVRTEGHTWWET